MTTSGFSKILRVLRRHPHTQPFRSVDYWERRYALGGTSGAGSYGQLAEFKAQVLNAFVREKHIASVIEFGCGDGNQVRLASYPNYIGLDVSPTAIAKCASIFVVDSTKSFFLYDPFCFMDNAHVFRAELALSLDVLFHLTEDDVYEKYLCHLFESAIRYVIIYSWGTGIRPKAFSGHERPRDFAPLVAKRFLNWQLVEIIDNIYPYNPETEEGSLSNFHIYAARDRSLAERQ